MSPNYIDIDIKCIENNILTRDDYKGFDSLISKIIDAKVKEINSQITDIGMQSLSISSINQNTKNTYTSSFQSNIKQTVNQMDEIIRFKKIIGVHNKSANYVLELDNGYLVSGGPSSLIIYKDDNIKKKFEIEHNSIFPITNEKKSIDIIINTNKEIKIVTINKNGNIEEFLKTINCDIKSKFCFVLNKKYLIVNDEGFFQYNDILGKIIQIKGNIITNDTIFSGGIKINDYVLALTSNKDLEKGQDKIIFYNNMSKKIFKEIEGYSFAKSQNNLALIKGQILLCACTKYSETQKNGILLIKTNNEDVELMSHHFYDTGEFEVHCFCPLSLVNNSNNNKIFNDEKEIKQTNYCFIGGYDKVKNEGLIKIYKINYNDDMVKTQIEFIKDIALNNIIIDKKNEKNKFQGFKNPISCIIQSIKTQNIIITDLGGNVYLFDKPNINNY
jgi:Zn-finger protein